MIEIEIRLAVAEDRDAILHVAVDSGLFERDHVGELASSLDAFFASPGEGEHWMLAVEEGSGRVIGAAYAAPERMTEGTHNLLFIAVRRASQGRAVGTRLLRRAERVCRDGGARLLLVETSGLDAFERTRAFYRQHGYGEEARIRDYYAAGDDKVVFRKPLR